MSNRTLLEINHDFTDRIKNATLFQDALDNYLNHPEDQQNVDTLRHYGIVVLGYRHHTEKYHLTDPKGLIIV